jgi:hypothetical protein
VLMHFCAIGHRGNGSKRYSFLVFIFIFNRLALSDTYGVEMCI